MAGKGGGSWKVAYADFVTAMMAFFMVMWLTAQKPEVKEAVAHYFQDPFGTEEDPDRAAAASLLPAHEGGFPTQFEGQEPPKNDPSELERHKGGSGPRLGHDPRIRMQQHLDERALGDLIAFPEASAELDDAAKSQLDGLLLEIAGKPHKIEIRGYAVRRSHVEGGASADEWQLCYARCVAAMQYLCQQGIEPNRIRLSQAGVYGSRPRRGGDEVQIRKSGVEIFLLQELAEPLPGVMPQSQLSPFQEHR
jgi:chemotaxis protein MotB